MKLDDIYDVLKKNISKGCSIHLLGSCIENNESCSKLYEKCNSYDEFEKRVLNKECDSNIVYSLISMYGKDSDYHWYRIRDLFGERCFKTYSYDCDKPEVDEPCKILDGRYFTCYYDGFVAFVEY